MFKGVLGPSVNEPVRFNEPVKFSTPSYTKLPDR